MTNKDIQKALRGLGLYWGKIDGDIGPKSKQAIIAFQRLNSLTTDGIAGPKTLAKLFNKPFGNRDSDEVEVKPGVFPRQKDVSAFYGKVGTNQAKVILPYKMKLAWDTSKSVSRFSCHKKIVGPMQAIFEDTLAHYGLEEIQRLGLDLFGGCLNVRKMRGGSRYSMHSWGIAVDLDPARNQLKWNSKKASFAKPEFEAFWDIVEKHGAISLGRERDFDWMHFQFARL